MDESDPNDIVDPVDEDERPENKVARLIKTYNMGDTAAEMEEGWTAVGDEHKSLRDLSDYFNMKLLEHHLNSVGYRAPPSELEMLYDTLTGEDTTGEQISVQRRLEQMGIDVEGVLAEFVSYQTVRRYLQEYRQLTYQQEKQAQVGSVDQQLQRIRGRVSAVTRNNLHRLRDRSELELGSFQTTIDIRVYCEDCSSQYRVSDLLEKGGCDCV